MSALRRISGRLIFLLMLFALAAGSLQSAEPVPPGVVVLRNGNVLAGRIDRSGDSFRVVTANSAIVVPADQVDFACASLQEACEVQRRRIGSSIPRKCELARWCLRHGLLDEAARETLEIRTAAPDCLVLPSLQLQLKQALELRSLQSAVGQEPRKPNAGVVLASATEPAPANPGISIDAQSQFIRSIQPMLLHTCATGGCHQPGSQDKLQLDRWALEGGGNPMLVRRNLEAVLAQLNKQNPAQSALVERARTAHGSPGQPPSRPLSALQSTLLLNWLNQVAGVKPPEAAPPSSEAAPAEEALDEDLSFDDIQLDAKSVKASAPPKFKPRDAFDPEIFNRRHAKRAFTGAPASANAK
jgi:hypothetical protein